MSGENNIEMWYNMFKFFALKLKAFNSLKNTLEFNKVTILYQNIVILAEIPVLMFSFRLALLVPDLFRHLNLTCLCDFNHTMRKVSNSFFFIMRQICV